MPTCKYKFFRHAKQKKMVFEYVGKGTMGRWEGLPIGEFPTVFKAKRT